MKRLVAFSVGLAIIFFCLPFPNAFADEIEVAPGIKAMDPSNTGAAVLSVPIEVPPGRNGMAPNLALRYNSSGGYGWLGMGWNLEPGAIQRSTKNGVNYNGTDFIFLKDDASLELTSRGDWGANYYGAKIEGAFTKYFFNSSTGGWEVTTKDGTKYYYGSTTSSRQNNPWNYNNNNQVFKWLLDKVQDLNGNYMTFSYAGCLNTAYATAEFAPGLVLLGTNGGDTGYGFIVSQTTIKYVQVPLIGMSLGALEPMGDTIVEMIKRLKGN